MENRSNTWGTDAVHGHNNVIGEQFFHNIGLAQQEMAI